MVDFSVGYVSLKGETCINLCMYIHLLGLVNAKGTVEFNKGYLVWKKETLKTFKLALNVCLCLKYLIEQHVQYTELSKREARTCFKQVAVE